VTLRANQPLAESRTWLLSGLPGATHSSFPIVADDGAVLGVVTRAAIAAADPHDTRAIRAVTSPEPLVVYEDMSLREATDIMALGGVDLLPVVPRAGVRAVLGVLTRTDLLTVARTRLAEETVAPPTFRLRRRNA
jgi:CBS domain-containing protein